MRFHFKMARFKTITRTLTDSDGYPNGTPEDFIVPNTRFLVIYAM